MSYLNPEIQFSALYPISSDPNFHGYSVDIAVLEQDVTKILESNAYTIQLSPVYLSYASFQAMFYREMGFKPVKHLCDISGANILVQNKQRTVLGGPFDDSQVLDSSFNLLRSLLSVYEKDLGISISCWDGCSLLDFQKLINPIKCLTDIIGSCNENVKCAMNIDDFFASLEAQGLMMDPTSGLPLDPSNNSPPDVIYQGVVSANIIAKFHSTTPGVKDLQVYWPFLINFNSYISEPTPNTDVWPHIYKTPLPNAVNRSDLNLIKNVVDDDGIPLPASGAFPAYTRYNAYQYSSIHN